MLSLAIAIAISASIMRAYSTLKESRLKPQYFTRNRKLPFQKLLKYLLSMHIYSERKPFKAPIFHEKSQTSFSEAFKISSFYA